MNNILLKLKAKNTSDLLISKYLFENLQFNILFKNV